MSARTYVAGREPYFTAPCCTLRSCKIREVVKYALIFTTPCCTLHPNIVHTLFWKPAQAPGWSQAGSHRHRYLFIFTAPSSQVQSALCHTDSHDGVFGIPTLDNVQLVVSCLPWPPPSVSIIVTVFLKTLNG